MIKSLIEDNNDEFKKLYFAGHTLDEFIEFLYNYATKLQLLSRVEGGYKDVVYTRFVFEEQCTISMFPVTGLLLINWGMFNYFGKPDELISKIKEKMKPWTSTL